MRRGAWRVAHIVHGAFSRGRVRTLCNKDVSTLNKEAIGLKMTNELYTYMLKHTRESPLLQKLRIETSTLRGAQMQVLFMRSTYPGCEEPQQLGLEIPALVAMLRRDSWCRSQATAAAGHICVLKCSDLCVGAYVPQVTDMR